LARGLALSNSRRLLEFERGRHRPAPRVSKVSPHSPRRHYCPLSGFSADHRSEGTAATRSGLISTYFFPAACDKFLRASRIESVAERTAASSRGVPDSAFSCLFPKIAAAIAAFPSFSFSGHMGEKLFILSSKHCGIRPLPG